MKIFVDRRGKISAPFGVFSHLELEAIFHARGKRGKPLGRNAIYLWLLICNLASGRKTQGFELNDSCIEKRIPKESSRYEAFANLIHAGFLVKVGTNSYSLAIPDQDIVTLDSEKTTKKTNSEKSNSEKTKTKKGKTLVFSESTPLIYTRINSQEITPYPKGKKNKEIMTASKREQKEIESFIEEILTQYPNELLGTQDQPLKPWEARERILRTPVKNLVKLSVHGSKDSLLSKVGYTGSMRQRDILGPFQAVLERLPNIEAPQWTEYPSHWQKWRNLVLYFAEMGSGWDVPNPYMDDLKIPPPDLLWGDIDSYFEAEEERETARLIFTKYGVQQ